MKITLLRMALDAINEMDLSDAQFFKQPILPETREILLSQGIPQERIDERFVVIDRIEIDNEPPDCQPVSNVIDRQRQPLKHKRPFKKGKHR